MNFSDALPASITFSNTELQGPPPTKALLARRKRRSTPPKRPKHRLSPGANGGRLVARLGDMIFCCRCRKIAGVPARSLPPSHPSQLRVVVVEDDVACRVALVEAVNATPDLRLAWAVATRAEALDELARATDGPADVLVVDLGLPDGSGLDVIAAARRLWPDCVAMVSTIFGDEDHVLNAIQAGAMGYLLKDVNATQMVDEIRQVAAGGSPISPMVARKLLLRHTSEPAAADSPRPVDQGGEAADAVETDLSAREVEVLRLVARGHTLDEVARALSLSRHTVRTFVRRLYAKLQVNTRAQAVREGQRQGLL